MPPPGPLPADPVVLVDGDLPALVAEAVSSLLAGLVSEGDRALAVEDVRGDEVDLAAVADHCATPPFLVERRIVILRDVGRFPTEEVAPLLQYLQDPLPTTTLILAAGEGAVPQKLVAAVQSAGRVVSTRVGGRDVAGWVHNRLERSAVRVDAEAEGFIRSHLGEDIGRLAPLLDVLVTAYGEGARLGAEEIRPYVGEAGSVAPWEFTDAIDGGHTEEALILLHRLLSAGERHPLVVLAILHRHVQSLLRVDGPAIRTEAQAAEAMGIQPGRSTYPAKKALVSARRWGSRSIADAVGLVADAEVALKGASSWPADAVLEVLVARLCRLARTGGRAPVAGGARRS